MSSKRLSIRFSDSSTASARVGISLRRFWRRYLFIDRTGINDMRMDFDTFVDPLFIVTTLSRLVQLLALLYYNHPNFLLKFTCIRDRSDDNFQETHTRILTF